MATIFTPKPLEWYDNGADVPDFCWPVMPDSYDSHGILERGSLGVGAHMLGITNGRTANTPNIHGVDPYVGTFIEFINTSLNTVIPSVLSDQVTFYAWVNSNSHAGNFDLIGGQDKDSEWGSNGEYFHLRHRLQNPYFRASEAFAATSIEHSTFAFQSGEWRLIHGVVGPLGIQVYMDGVPHTSWVTPQRDLSAVNEIWIGGPRYFNSLDTKIAEVGIYLRTLTQAEITRQVENPWGHYGYSTKTISIPAGVSLEPGFINTGTIYTPSSISETVSAPEVETGGTFTPTLSEEIDFSFINDGGTFEPGVAESTSISMPFINDGGTFEPQEYIGLVIQTSRTSGVAPLSVFFDTVETTGKNKRHWSEHEIKWNFDDDREQRWTVRNLDKNVALGACANHVFDVAGTYTVEVTLDDLDGNTASGTVDITVTDPDVVFAGTDTICVSSSGNFDGAPAGATEITTADFNTAIASWGDNQRILFRRGESFNAATQTSLDVTGSTLGDFGDPNDGDPIIHPTTVETTQVLFWIESHDVRYLNIIWDGYAGTSNRNLTLFNESGEMDRNLFYGCTFQNCRYGLILGMFGTTLTSGPMHYGQAFVENTFDTVEAVMCFTDGNQIAYQGNTTLNGSSHVFRNRVIDRMVINHNLLSGNGAGYHLIKQHSASHSHATDDSFGNVIDTGTIAFATSRWIIIADNHFAPSNYGWNAQISPEDTWSEQYIEKVIVERNSWINDGPSWNYNWVVACQDLLFRNNLVQDDSTYVLAFNHPMVPVRDIRVKNVSMYATDTYGGSIIEVSEDTSEITVKNCSVFAPSFSGDGIVVSNDNTDTPVLEVTNQDVNTSPYVEATPAIDGDYHARDYVPASGSVLVGAGTADDEIFNDFLGNRRDATPIDIGALSFQTQFVTFINDGQTFEPGVTIAAGLAISFLNDGGTFTPGISENVAVGFLNSGGTFTPGIGEAISISMPFINDGGTFEPGVGVAIVIEAPFISDGGVYMPGVSIGVLVSVGFINDGGVYVPTLNINQPVTAPFINDGGTFDVASLQEQIDFSFINDGGTFDPERVSSFLVASSLPRVQARFTVQKRNPIFRVPRND